MHNEGIDAAWTTSTRRKDGFVARALNIIDIIDLSLVLFHALGVKLG